MKTGEREGEKERLQMVLISYQKTNLNSCFKFSRHSKLRLDSQSFCHYPQMHHQSPEVSLLTAIEKNEAHSDFCALSPESVV